MSIGHVITFTFLPGTSPETITRLTDALDTLAASSEGIESYRHGRDLEFRHGNADYAIAAVFRDRAALTAYLAAPQHLRLVTDLVEPHVTAKSSVQFECAGPAQR
ncbi:Dabb family protein [Prescottella soli]|uniref:Dabb family protein n=1 Tax=Prescottella soli TaxID=1543852 RepID=A0ABW9FNP6_9NOCA